MLKPIWFGRVALWTSACPRLGVYLILGAMKEKGAKERGGEGTDGKRAERKHRSTSSAAREHSTASRGTK